ncbi:Saccharopine dehydrogenase [Entomophthora muscae]|uniref:Saccharopine dehydrogenase n=1 Tax=Entomophthora muscae TaxID=34485 RepID=A0ACC2TVF4_9FUNG|nr:Saccharopine dehydrogenase [Entomophthora muscae]
MGVHLWLRHEVKPMEHRAALSPEACKTLIDNGFTITAEKSDARFFKDEEYKKVGCKLVESETWETNAPLDAFIIGLKELPEGTSPLKHSHIFFAHCFKEQTGWKELIKRFTDGKGTILDLEFLQDDSGRRVAAFGYHAGFTGSAVGIDIWCHNTDPALGKFPPIKPYPNQDELIRAIKLRLATAVQANKGSYPKIMVMGAKGRCGGGAVDFAKAVGIPETNILGWDVAETVKGGPFDEILGVDIFINCIYLSSKIPPFLTLESIAKPSRQLSVMVDVSCDYTSPNNPVPVYDRATYFDKPTLQVQAGSSNPPLEVVAIDHLPTMLPREASQAFARDLLPTLLALPNRQTAPVWQRATDLYKKKAMEASNQSSNL